MKKIIIFQILFLLIFSFAFQTQAEMRNDFYTFVNRTDNRALVQYDRDTPPLQKGYEVRPGACLYIHHNDFNHLSILLHIGSSTPNIESSSLMFCDSNEGIICPPANYTLADPRVIESNTHPDPSIIKEFSRIQTRRTPTAQHPEVIYRFALMKKRPAKSEECDVF